VALFEQGEFLTIDAQDAAMLLVELHEGLATLSVSSWSRE